MGWFLLLIVAFLFYRKFGLPISSASESAPSSQPTIGSLIMPPVYVGSPTGVMPPAPVMTPQNVPQPEAAQTQNLIPYAPAHQQNEPVSDLRLSTPYIASHPPLRTYQAAFGPTVNQPSEAEEW